jgi:alpha-glucosidase (family GH31 glycosyl hydrolase)
MGPIKQYTAEQVDGPLTLWVYPGGDTEFTLYEDDGTTFNYRRGDFMKLVAAWNNARRRLRLSLARGSRMLPPAKRNLVIRVAGETASREVVFDGKPLEVAL